MKHTRAIAILMDLSSATLCAHAQQATFFRQSGPADLTKMGSIDWAVYGCDKRGGGYRLPAMDWKDGGRGVGREIR